MFAFELQELFLGLEDLLLLYAFGLQLCLLDDFFLLSLQNYSMDNYVAGECGCPLDKPVKIRIKVFMMYIWFKSLQKMTSLTSRLVRLKVKKPLAGLSENLKNKIWAPGKGSDILRPVQYGIPIRVT